MASRAAKERCDAGYGIEANDTNEGVCLISQQKFKLKVVKQLTLKEIIIQHQKKLQLWKTVVRREYGNLFFFDVSKITDENHYETPMKIYPAVHYTMGGVWVDYNLQSTIPGCFVAGEANFSDHGANRLGASALMQGLADGYFVLPYTISNYLADEIRTGKISTESPEFAGSRS